MFTHISKCMYIYIYIAYLCIYNIYIYIYRERDIDILSGAATTAKRDRSAASARALLDGLQQRRLPVGCSSVLGVHPPEGNQKIGTRERRDGRR